MPDYETTIEQDIKQAKKKRHTGLFVFWLFLALMIIVGGFLFYKTGRTFNHISLEARQWQKAKEAFPEPENSPQKDPQRLNILLLGLRGAGDPNGGLLTDSLMVISIKKESGRVVLISLPRDLYLQMPNYSSKQKINFAYALGEQRHPNGGGLVYSTQVVSQVTGLYIDYVAAINFAAFESLVDTLGGIEVYRQTAFVEELQWLYEGRETSPFWRQTASSTWEFFVPQGQSLLDGETALYYVRSRYSTSDFDRMRRQQQVLEAVKDKVFSLGVITNPVKVSNLLGILGRNLRTNLGLTEVKDLIGLVRNLDTKNINKLVFDTAADGPLYASTSEEGAYIILPKDGNFDKVQQMCRDIFN